MRADPVADLRGVTPFLDWQVGTTKKGGKGKDRDSLDSHRILQ